MIQACARPEFELVSREQQQQICNKNNNRIKELKFHSHRFDLSVFFFLCLALLLSLIHTQTHTNKHAPTNYWLAVLTQCSVHSTHQCRMIELRI